jgi:penicillin-binding protein 1A
MFKNSGLYNPVRNPQVSENRRNVVLSQMEKSKMITDKIKTTSFTNYLEI